MTKKRYANLLLFALCGIIMWFFGNLYEAIVITPNLVIDPVSKVYHWQAFFTTTNPIFFYIPIAPAAIIITFVLYFKTDAKPISLKNHIAYAVIFLILALALSIYIITQINLRLFFGNIEKIAPQLLRLSILWNILNTIRVLLLAGVIYHLFRTYILILKTRPG